MPGTVLELSLDEALAIVVTAAADPSLPMFAKVIVIARAFMGRHGDDAEAPGTEDVSGITVHFINAVMYGQSRGSGTFERWRRLPADGEADR